MKLSFWSDGDNYFFGFFIISFEFGFEFETTFARDKNRSVRTKREQLSRDRRCQLLVSPLRTRTLSFRAPANRCQMEPDETKGREIYRCLSGELNVLTHGGSVGGNTVGPQCEYLFA